MKKIDWTSHFIELVVVFIGITAAFILNNWREDRAEDKLALKYYSSLLKDLTAEADQFDGLLDYSEAQDSILTVFLNNANEGNIPENLAPVITVLASINHFVPEQGTYETMKYSGNLDLFSDYELREYIGNYYNVVDGILLTQKIHYDYMSDYCIPYIYTHFNLLDGKLIPGAKIDHELTNVIAGYRALLQQNLTSYRQLVEENMSLKLKLAKKIAD